MSRVGTINLVSGQGAQMYADTVAAKLTAGWSIQSYGTGTGGTYSATGAGWTAASLTTLDRAWVRMRDPGGIVEDVCQFNNAGGNTNNTRNKYSPFAKFIGGSPNANTVPSATDEVFWTGGGTDASPTYEAITNVSGASPAKYHCVAENAPINGRYPYMFYGHTNGTTSTPFFFGLDVCLPGSQDPTDIDPCIACMVGLAGSRARYWIGLGGGGAIQLGATVTSQANTTGTSVLQPGSTNDPVGRAQIGASTTYVKGYAAFMKIKGIARAYPNVINPASDCQVYIGTTTAGYVLPGLNNQIPTL